MPTVKGRKSPSERFAGADDTYTIEALMQNGWALQSGTRVHGVLLIILQCILLCYTVQCSTVQYSTVEYISTMPNCNLQYHLFMLPHVIFIPPSYSPSLLIPKLDSFLSYFL